MNYHDEQIQKATRVWLNECGFSEQALIAVDTDILKAQKTAKHLLQLHSQLLNSFQLYYLNYFIKSFKNKTKRKAITQSSCYQVMNIGTSINRKLFKLHKQLEKALQAQQEINHSITG